MAENKLEFDKMVQDVSLAKAYFEAKKFEFRPSIDPKENSEKVIDNFGNEIYLSSSFESCNELSKRRSIKCEMEQLHKDLKSNIDLFAQLDYMLRKIPIDETKHINIKLILNEMQDFLLRNTDEPVVVEGSSCILFDDGAPSAVLGLTFHNIFKMNCNVEILATPDTAPTASLFVQLCQDAGFPVRLHLMKKEVIKKSKYFEFIPSVNKEISKGSVGVVTETADVDSAVDSFLASFSKMPWRLSQIFVQENVYESFQKSLQWKCQRDDASREGSRVAAEVKSKCAVVYEMGDKAFLIDYAGPELPPQEGVVAVVAYRSPAELVARRRGALRAQWGADAGMAAAAGAAHVALNDGVGGGALHRAFYSSFSAPRFENYPREHGPWPARHTLINFLDEYANKEAGNGTAAVFKQMLLKYPERPDRVTMENDGLSVVMTSPSEVICAPYRSEIDITRVAEGLALAFYSNSLFVVQLMNGRNVDYCQTILESLIALQENVPIYIDRNSEFICGASWYQVKSIWTKFKVNC